MKFNHTDLQRFYEKYEYATVNLARNPIDYPHTHEELLLRKDALSSIKKELTFDELYFGCKNQWEG